jgi:hypothetical protein
MNTLDKFCRPMVVFSVDNVEHRQHYKDFVRYSTWGRCPVRFEVPEEVGMDLVTMIQRKLLEYYMAQDRKLDKEAA